MDKRKYTEHELFLRCTLTYNPNRGSEPTAAATCARRCGSRRGCGSSSCGRSCCCGRSSAPRSGCSRY